MFRKASLNQRHIVAIGGNLHKVTGASTAFFKYVLSLSNHRQEKPNLLFITTATGDKSPSVLALYQDVATLPCTASHLSFFERTPPNLRELILAQDVIFVGGGNTKSMLAVWREYGLDQILKTAWDKGIVLSGSSAGGICWFESCLTDSFAGSYRSLAALGFLTGSCCPHYDNEVGRRETYHKLILSGKLKPGYALDECAGIHFVDHDVFRAISSLPTARAYQISVARKQGKKGNGSKVVEQLIPTTVLS